jgi:hypothetical protein
MGADNMADNIQTTYTDNDKRRWEIEKLRAETTNLKRPYIKSPSSWITIMTALVAVLGIGIQYAKSDREYKLAEIQRQQAVLARQQVLEEIDQANKVLANLQAQQAQVSQRLNRLQANAKQLGEIPTPEAKQLVQELDKSVADLNKINEQAAKQSEKTKESLRALGERLARSR